MKSGLFWKLMLAFWLAFFAITQSAWLLIQLENSSPPNETFLSQRVAPVLLGELSKSISEGGLATALRRKAAFSEDDRRRIEILLASAGRPVTRDDVSTIERDAQAPDGTQYYLRYNYRNDVGEFGWASVLIFGIIGGPLFGAFVAWYLITPIRRLRRGFERIATGDLSVRISPDAGGRRDELADLIRDFDVMAARLDQSIRARDRLLNDVSHELRSPLSRLQLAIGLAQQDPGSVASWVERITYEGRRLDSVIRELLTLARTENGLPAEQGYFDVAGIVDSVIADARFEVEATGVRIVHDSRCVNEVEESPTLYGSAELVRWAIENVVRNAIRYSTAGQTVSIRVEFEVETNHCIIEIRDEGPGVPEGSLPTLFDPFVRGEEVSQGFGLGLAIAKRAVLAHGGTIQARNRASSGLLIRIELPVAMNGRATTPTTPKSTEAATSPKPVPSWA